MSPDLSEADSGLCEERDPLNPHPCPTSSWQTVQPLWLSLQLSFLLICLHGGHSEGGRRKGHCCHFRQGLRWRLSPAPASFLSPGASRKGLHALRWCVDFCLFPLRGTLLKTDNNLFPSKEMTSRGVVRWSSGWPCLRKFHFPPCIDSVNHVLNLIDSRHPLSPLSHCLTQVFLSVVT